MVSGWAITLSTEETTLPHGPISFLDLHTHTANKNNQAHSGAGKDVIDGAVSDAFEQRHHREASL